MIWIAALLSALTSNEASYDGNGLKLVGQVLIEHPLGKMEAEEALIQKKEESSEEFQSIHLSKDVKLSLHTHGSVTCETADFDLATYTGALLPKEGQRVHYTHPAAKGAPLEMYSKQVQLRFESGAAHPLVEAIRALGDVSISFGDGYLLQAAAADYGKTHLTASSNGGVHCKLTHGSDRLEAEEIQLFSESSTLSALHPHGHFPSLALSEGGALSFACDQLTWNQETQSLQFEKQIHVEEATLGTVQAQRGFAQYGDEGLSSFTLTEDVRLLKGEQRCGLADELHYSHKDQTATLKATGQRRVLFWDQSKGIAISARAVQIHRHPETGEEEIQGIGNVRFQFSGAEHALLKKLFPSLSLPEAHADPQS